MKASNPSSDYGAIVDKNLSKVERGLASMRQRIETLNTERIATMSTEIKQVERAQACVRYTVTDTGVRTRHVESTVVSIEKAVSDLYISHEAGVKSQTGLLHMLIDDMGKAKCGFEVDKSL